MLKNFVGVLVSDFYAAYDSMECPQQKCLIHFIRDLNDALIRGGARTRRCRRVRASPLSHTHLACD
jgi:hypothetical protein